ncbi:MAG TPA: CHAT domain-containing tetratricopeptide repeat protein [Terriglobales bacterium]|nr:CHAT domain-containing tetratricopeptide repeat protein [Terriglobales bacterium]
MHQRLSGQGEWQRRWRRRLGRSSLALCFVFLACVRARNPQLEFEQAQQIFFHGNLTGAQEQAERGWRYYSSRDLVRAWEFRVLDAKVLAWRGMYSDVFSVLNAELPASLKNSDLDFQRRAQVGIAYIGMHRLAEAETVLAELEKNCLTSGSDVIGQVFIPLGMLQVERGEYNRAQVLFEKSLQFARQRRNRFLEAVASLKLSNTALQQEHFEEAIDWSNAAYNAAKELDARLIIEVVEGNLGWAYYKMGDSERSLSLYVEAIQHARELGDLFDEVKWLTNTGYVYLDAGKFALAEDYYRQSLDLARKLDSKEDILNALVALAFVTVQTGQLDLAKQYSGQAIAQAHADGNRVDELYPLLVKGQIAFRNGDLSQAEQTFLEIATDPKVDPSLQWEAQHELAGIYEDEHRFPDAEKVFRTALSSFDAARTSLHHEDFELPFMTNATQLYDDYIHFLLQRGKTGEALQAAEYSRAQTLAEGLGLLQKSPHRVAAALDPRQIARNAGGTILFYWLGPKQSCLWAVTRDRVRLFQLPPASEIDAAVQSYRKALLSPRDVLQTANPEGTKLFEMLVAPARQVIAPNSDVAIIPDGSLNGLNFETLLVPEPNLHYWIEDVTVINASSLTLLAAAHSSSRTKGGKLLLIGDAVAPDREYGELPEAALEITNIEKHFRPADRQIYTRVAATAPAYLGSSPEQFAYIHFVAHGTASRLSPLDSAVILSRASAEEDSFKLYARDIIHRPLHADLVTISTCYGAGARAYTGEGLVGLSWAFLRAGAHNVIGALWEVSDASTPRLMDQLYDELKQGRTPEVALRSAKLSLLHSDGVFRKPFYWAPFQLYTGT